MNTDIDALEYRRRRRQERLVEIEREIRQTREEMFEIRSRPFVPHCEYEFRIAMTERALKQLYEERSRLNMTLP